MFSFTSLTASTSLDVIQKSQFFDKDFAVCLESSFSSVMTFRRRTSAVLFHNWPTENIEVLIIKLKGICWLV